MPQGRYRSVGSSAGRHRAGHEDERRGGQRGPEPGKRAGGDQRLCKPWPSHRKHQTIRPAGGRGHQPFHTRYRSRDRGGQGLRQEAGIGSHPLQALGFRFGRNQRACRARRADCRQG